MHFLPILSTLRRHRTAAALIVLEIAFTCAIVCNAVFLIGDRIARMDRPSGIAEDEIVRVLVTGIGKGTDADSITTQDLQNFRSIPGVKYAAVSNMLPFGNSSWNSDVFIKPKDFTNGQSTAMYMGTQDLIETFGLRLVAGRDFTADEFVTFADLQGKKAHMPSIIITSALAEKLFPGQNALGKVVYVWGDDPITIVGLIDHIARPNEGNGIQYAKYSMFLPVTLPYAIGGNYVLRVEPARKAEILALADATLDKVDPNRIILERQTYAEIRKEHFKQDRAMAWLLVGVSAALLLITALGVVGLASFWVQQRQRQIGIRRALGATRRDILRYFQLENFILATMGIIVGMLLAYGINHWLMGKYGVARLPAEFLPVGAAVLWLLGQVAVLGPALRASLIPPAIATRSV